MQFDIRGRVLSRHEVVDSFVSVSCLVFFLFLGDVSRRFRKSGQRDKTVTAAFQRHRLFYSSTAAIARQQISSFVLFTSFSSSSSPSFSFCSNSLFPHQPSLGHRHHHTLEPIPFPLRLAYGQHLTSHTPTHTPLVLHNQPPFKIQ